MNRTLFVALLGAGALLLLASCATDDDPFPTHPVGSAETEPVAGAATPPPQDATGGWKW